ncbi:restriction endonuclease subunit S [Nocardia sp. CA-136227]|uniref:restriction endonuclease subunit S n=1 Tax=Nocardia sp. CA-136227 TaxID=3239979 RepID=UPI003D99ED0E
MSRASIAPWLATSQWPTVPIRLVARLGSGHTPSRKVAEYWENCDIPWITLADVWQLRNGAVDVITETKEMISALGLANSSAAIHPAGTVILSRTASVGFSAIMGSMMATSQDFATWTCGPRLEPRYLLHALRGMAPDLKRIAMGSTHKTIYMPDIEQLRIPLPNIEEQRRIAEFLDAETSRIDRISHLQSRVLAKLHEREMAHRDAAIDRLFDSGGAVQLRRHIWSVDQGVSPQCDAVPASDDEWGVLKVSCLRPCVFDPTQNKRLPPDISPNRSSEVRKGDLLIVRANTPELVGSAAVVGDVRSRLLLPDKIFRVRLDSKFLPEFVAEVAAGSRVRAMSAASSNGASQSMANIRFDQVKAWKIPIADLHAQERFVEKMTANRKHLFEIGRAIERQLALIEERRQSLITSAVTGQLDVATATGRSSTSL